uniref:E3 ubiquitin-protein ligase TRIM71-like n=1 Tax=Crassostrea virginica TaxID=6565 RepID=A0A8B8BY59_CRAVI|nr:E3 ubiquitin-protein ligase TRIM71-like [Crassostrea virginica]
MDPRHSAQDVVRCALCRDAVAPMYCNVCHTHLCGDCVEEHFSNKSKVHTVVPLEQFLSTLNYPKCSTHPTEQCELHCELCDIPICSSCISSGKHIGHLVDNFESCESKNEVIRKDLEELEKSILPNYKKSAVIITTQKTDQHKHYQKLTAEINKQGDALHREINSFIQRKQSEIDDMNAQHLAALEKQEDVINTTLHEIKQIILHLKSLLESSNVSRISKYKSRHGDFRKLPPKLKISPPNFQPQKINREQLLKQFGSLSSLSIETVEQGYTAPSSEDETSHPARPLLDVPRLIADIPTSGYDYLYNVSGLSDEKFWTRGNNEIMKLYNMKGEVIESVQSKSGNMPADIAVTQKGGLVYADYNDSSINLVRGSQIQTLITLLGWTPLSLCNYDAGAVVVVSAAGKLRFRYTGPPSTPRESFRPFGITTDSCGNILISDRIKHRIHITDREGHFLRFIHNCGLQAPWGLCVDSKDYLFVTEKDTGKVKKILYYK